MRQAMVVMKTMKGLKAMKDSTLFIQSFACQASAKAKAKAKMKAKASSRR